MRKNSIKNTRINGEVQNVLAELIRAGMKDPRVSSLTSVVQVEVAPDLANAKVYISVLGNEEVQKNTIAGLKSAEGYLRSQLAKKINLRHTPQLHFVLDQSIEYGVNMSRLIREVNEQMANAESVEEIEEE